MNCKPGDLAYIVGASRHAGKVVQVVELAPIGVNFRLPDGHMQGAQDYEWVCYFPTPQEIGLSDGTTRMTHYATVPDRVLRPIGGVPVCDEQRDEVVA